MDLYNKTIYARLKAFSLCIIVLVFVLIYRLFIIGVSEHSHYLALAQGQQRFVETQVASRGQILVHDSAVDQNSYYPLAFDVKKFDVMAIPNQIGDKAGTAAKLSQSLNIAQSQIYGQINNNKMYVPPLKKGLTLDEANNLIDKKISGVYVFPEYSRYYPENTLASQVLGFVNNDGKGNYGVEGYYNDELKGKSGDLVGEKDTLGRMISILNETNPQNGASYVLTIDRSVQYYVEKSLAAGILQYQADSGTVIVMDVKTGGIIAMASSPTYDPNNFSQTAKDNPRLFINPAITSLYEPGSILKPLIASAALDAGVLTTDMTSTFGASVNVQGYTIHTAEDKAFGTENIAQILQHSDNVGMVWVSNLLGNQRMYDYVEKYGFSNKTGVDLSGEQAGQVPLLKNWRDINRATISFGQGISVTPLQMVTAYATIANNGKYVYPHLVDKIIVPDGSQKKIEKQEGQQVVSPTTASTVRNLLYSVVQAGNSVKAAVPGFKVGVKTGTAQIPLPTGGYLASDNNLGIFIHSVIGMAPTDNPEFVMLVKLDKPKTAPYAESTSAPLFGQIASFLLNYHYRTTPTEPIK